MFNITESHEPAEGSRSRGRDSTSRGREAPRRTEQMSAIRGAFAAEERLRWLHGRLRSDGSVTIAEAAQALDVSEMTIRRDLGELEQRGVARRVRGGARSIGPRSFTARRDTAVRAKSTIARKLSPLLPQEGAVAFDASSTVMRLASLLSAARDLLVVTNGPDTFAAIQGIGGVTALLTGGRLDGRTGSLVGPLACRGASQIAVQTFFLSAAASTPQSGTLEATIDEAEVKRSLAVMADRVVLAVDSSKLDTSALAVGLEWGRIDLMVTELDPDDERLAPYRRLTRVV